MNLKEKEKFMARAISLAQRAKGKTAPNPCVGAVLVKEGKVVASGYHRGYGLPHAEVEVLKDARKKNIDPRECALFVTLEPCNHFGKTPPCTKAILEAGIKEVYVGALDPNPQVEGGGARFLQSKGVQVETGILQAQCTDLIRDFYLWKIEKRPFFYLKLASTLDGKIATSTGHSSWISSEKSRAKVHQLRKKVQAVLVGGNTFVQDNPKLTVRKAKSKKQPLALILTRKLPAEASYYLLQQRPEETIFFTLESQENLRLQKKISELGSKVVFLPVKNNSWDLKAMATWLWNNNIFYVLVEGGGFIAQKFLEYQLADEIWLFLAPKILGDAGAISSFWGRSIKTIDEAYTLSYQKVTSCGEDLLLILKP